MACALAAEGRAAGRSRVLPGFGATLGVTLTYLSLIVLLPLAGLFLRASGLGWADWLALVSTPRVLAAFRVSFGIALAAALINGVIGLLIAWVLVRYRFPGKDILDALVDLPFALPTAVAGIALTSRLCHDSSVRTREARYGAAIRLPLLPSAIGPGPPPGTGGGLAGR